MSWETFILATDWEKSTHIRLPVRPPHARCSSPIIDQDVLHFEVSLFVSRDPNIDRTCSADSRSSNSMKAYCKLSPVFLSRTTSQLKILPNREKINSRSSSCVTGFNLHTNKMFSGGRTAANGISPIISSVRADEAAAVRRVLASLTSSGTSASGSSSSDIRTTAADWASGGRRGEGGGVMRLGGSGNGSSTPQQAN